MPKHKATHRRRFSRRRGTVRHHSHNIPLAPVIGVAGGLGITAVNAFNASAGKSPMGRLEQTLDQIGQSVYGYSVSNQQWTTNNLARFWAPVAGGALAHKAAGWLGINRVLARAKLGFTI